ncbi:MAG: ATP-dependent 6-phosphofructokinase [Chloroflexi bacterium]|nr:ATP-dependent 6-phosphofructokinase [Chloroflexota bacterium]
MKRIGILTGGGDAPGLNAVIRAVVKAGESTYNCQLIGIRHGFEGFLEENGVLALTNDLVADILPKGGTILGAANRGNPFARRVVRNGKETIEDVSNEVVERISELDLHALIVVGGDGTLGIARDLHNKGVPVVGVPKTIDNDVGGTEVTFGFDTALNIAMEALDRLRTTAESHHRVMLLEVMGRNAGFIALHAGVSGGADVILIPEVPFSMEPILKRIRAREAIGRHHSIIVVSEGAAPAGGEQIFSRAGDELSTARLGGVSYKVAGWLEENAQIETRVTVLGHIQRGGTPTSFDRWLASRYGAAALRMAAEGNFGQMLAYQCEQIVAVPLDKALQRPKRVDLQGDAMQTARELGIAFGD